mmetsp:Transcript_9355/g.26942  ORF Transcript_9355/g.26942 Transcript_9355/m.26942 type:complete len:266 (-) Transcript_9355:80-877(-)
MRLAIGSRVIRSDIQAHAGIRRRLQRPHRADGPLLGQHVGAVDLVGRLHAAVLARACAGQGDDALGVRAAGGLQPADEAHEAAGGHSREAPEGDPDLDTAAHAAALAEGARRIEVAASEVLAKLLRVGLLAEVSHACEILPRRALHVSRPGATATYGAARIPGTEEPLGQSENKLVDNSRRARRRHSEATRRRLALRLQLQVQRLGKGRRIRGATTHKPMLIAVSDGAQVALPLGLVHEHSHPHLQGPLRGNIQAAIEVAALGSY